MLIYETPEQFEARRHTEAGPYLAAWRTYYSALVDAGAWVGSGAPLEDPGTGTTVRVKDGRRLVQDGPFAEAKDQLGGFMILDFASLDDALHWAARCPAAAEGAVEVRPVDSDWHANVIDG